MTVKEKIELAALKDKLFCFKEGMFYKVYNQNAMWFNQNIKAYKVNIKFVKTVNQLVYSLGFPQHVLSTNTLSLNLDQLEETNGYICYKISHTFTNKEYYNWCNTIPQQKLQEQKTASKDIIQALKNFDLVNKTPMQAFEFVAKLKTEL